MAKHDDPLRCPICEKAYRRKPELAGRKVKCGGCAAVLRVPADGQGPFELLRKPETPKLEHGDDAAGGYDFDAPDTAGAGTSQPTCPSCNAKVKPTAVICINCGYDLKAGKPIKTEIGVAEDDNGGSRGPEISGVGLAGPRFDTEAMAADTQREIYRQEVLFPLILVGVGVSLLVLNALVLFPEALAANAFAQMFAPSGRLEQIAMYLKYAGLRLAMQVPLALGGIFFTAAIFSTSYGTIGKALVKLLALVLVVSCFEDSLNLVLDIATGGFGGIGFLLVFSLSVGLFLALAMWLFDMEPLEASVLWLILLIGPWVINLFITPLLEAWGIPVI